MSILAYCKNHKSVAIYGAGEMGTYLLNLLKMTNVHISCFVVSNVNKSEKVEGIPVYDVSSWLETRDKNEGVLIGVSEKYRGEIEENLQTNGLEDYFYASTEKMQELKRDIAPIEPENFLKQSEPVSHIFGYDRGTSICRVYIDKFLDDIKEYIPQNPKMTLEVGDTRYTDILFPNATKDVLSYSKGMDLTKEDTIPKNKYDVFVATQVFNFIYDLETSIKNSYKLLLPSGGGVMIGTVSGLISPVSLSDMKNYGHFWGFTDLCVKNLLSDVFGKNNVKVFGYGNALSATAFVQGLSYEDIENKTLLDDSDNQYAVVIGFIAKKV